MKVTWSRFTKDTKHCHKLIYLLESYCPLSYTFPAHLILFILKKKASLLLQGMICLMCVVLEQSFIFMMY